MAFKAKHPAWVREAITAGVARKMPPKEITAGLADGSLEGCRRPYPLPPRTLREYLAASRRRIAAGGYKPAGQGDSSIGRLVRVYARIFDLRDQGLNAEQIVERTGGDPKSICDALWRADESDGKLPPGPSPERDQAVSDHGAEIGRLYHLFGLANDGKWRRRENPYRDHLRNVPYYLCAMAEQKHRGRQMLAAGASIEATALTIGLPVANAEMWFARELTARDHAARSFSVHAASAFKPGPRSRRNTKRRAP